MSTLYCIPDCNACSGTDCCIKLCAPTKAVGSIPKTGLRLWFQSCLLLFCCSFSMDTAWQPDQRKLGGLSNTFLRQAVHPGVECSAAPTGFGLCCRPGKAAVRVEPRLGCQSCSRAASTKDFVHTDDPDPHPAGHAPFHGP